VILGLALGNHKYDKEEKENLVAWLGFTIVSFYRLFCNYAGLIGNTNQKRLLCRKNKTGKPLLDCAT
jgi:hypothetical protein